MYGKDMDNANTTVTLLLNQAGQVCSVYASAEKAKARAAKFNADPFLSPGEPDPDVPYSTRTWHLYDVKVR